MIEVTAITIVEIFQATPTQFGTTMLCKQGSFCSSHSLYLLSFFVHIYLGKHLAFSHVILMSSTWCFFMSSWCHPMYHCTLFWNNSTSGITVSLILVSAVSKSESDCTNNKTHFTNIVLSRHSHDILCVHILLLWDCNWPIACWSYLLIGYS